MAQTNDAAPKTVSLVSDTARLCIALAEIQSRISRIADTLHGSAPATGASAPQPPDVPTVRHNLDGALGRVESICGELSRVEGQL